jgi:predicted nucleic acid-binding protein
MEPEMKVLADSSIWIDHIRHGIREMDMLLKHKSMAVHPYVIGELACGTLPNRAGFIRDLGKIPATPTVPAEETMDFLERHRLYGLGLGWVDISLLASALVSGVSLWTRDKALHKAAIKLRIAF